MKQDQTMQIGHAGKLRLFGSVELGSWRAAFASLLPLWLVTLGVSAEGFPHPPITGKAVQIVLGLAFVLGILLLAKGWMTFELALVSLIPLVFFIPLDEITTAYKTPFLFAAAAILSLGILGYQRSLHGDSVTRAWAILLVSVVLTVFLVWHAAGNFWQMQSDFGVGNCFFDYTGCPALTGNEPPWWRLMFGL